MNRSSTHTGPTPEPGYSANSMTPASAAVAASVIKATPSDRATGDRPVAEGVMPQLSHHRAGFTSSPDRP